MPDERRPKLVLIDGHALAYRAYHALSEQGLSTSTGELTGGVFGFVQMLLTVLRDERPDYIAVTWDAGLSGRRDDFPDYKANRSAAPNDLPRQVGRIREVLDAFRIRSLEVPGYEADDLLGTLALRASEEGYDTLIVTGDSDTFQLVGPHVRILTTRGRFNETIVYDEGALYERYGLAPAQLIDHKALKGDTSDNVPGVPGIGDKTATSLLQKYHTVEGILAHLDEVKPPRIRENIGQLRGQVLLNKRLVTIRGDVPLDVDWDDLCVQPYDLERVTTLFRELQFRRLMERLPGRKEALEDGGSTEGKPETDGEPGSAPEQTSSDGVAAHGPVYTLVDTADKLTELAERLRSSLASHPSLSIDTETTSTDPLRAMLVGLALTAAEGEGYYIPIAHRDLPPHGPTTWGGEEGGTGEPNPPAPFPTREGGAYTPPLLGEGAGERSGESANLPIETVQAVLGPVLADPNVPKVAHNANYDLAVLWEHGLDVQGPLFDTMVAAWLADPGRGQIGLKDLAWTRLGVEMTNIQALIGKGRDQVTMDHVAAARAAQYAGADVDMTLRLASLLEGELRDRELLDLFNGVEMPLVPILTRMEMNGILLDVDYLLSLSTEFYQRMNVLEKDIYELVGYPFNLGSTQQLASVLFEHLALPPKKRTKTGFSTDITVLEELRGMHPVIEKLIEHRQLAKLKSTYIDALPLLVHPRTRRIHTDFNQCGSATGRISSSNPNLQNIPIRTDEGKRIRHAFAAPPGHVLLTADYSQIELRILAAMTKEPTLVEAFEHDEDIHARTAALLFNIPLDQVTPNQRRLAKTTNFGIIYGISGFGLAARTDLTTDEALTFIKNYNAKLPGVEKLMDDFKKQARRDGYVSTLLGRRRYFPGLKSGARLPLAERQRLEREAINAPVQGTAADIVKLAMVRLERGLREAGLAGKMLLQVHDELVLEVPADEVERTIPVIREAMEEAFELPGVRLKVDLAVGERWSEVADVMAPEGQGG